VLPYARNLTPPELEKIPEFLHQELGHIENALASIFNGELLTTRNEEPNKLRDGTILIADGTNWDPGSGAGVYVYLNGSWRFLLEVPTAGYWDDLTADLATGRAGASSPAWAVFQGGVYAYQYANSGPIEELQISFHFQHTSKENVKAYPHIHWSPSDTGTGVVRWGLEFTFQEFNSAFPTTTTVYLEQAGSGTALDHLGVEVAEVDAIGPTTVKPGSLLLCRVFRDHTHANDTYGAGAFAHEVDVHFLKERFGTASRFA